MIKYFSIQIHLFNKGPVYRFATANEHMPSGCFLTRVFFLGQSVMTYLTLNKMAGSGTNETFKYRPDTGQILQDELSYSLHGGKSGSVPILMHDENLIQCMQILADKYISLGLGTRTVYQQYFAMKLSLSYPFPFFFIKI